MDTNALIGDMDMICSKPESPDLPKTLVVADCAGANPEITCKCCFKCCQPGGDFNDDTLVPSNDPMWQFGYDRVFYDFGNLTGYFMAASPTD